MAPNTLATAMGIPLERAHAWAEPLTRAMARFEIDTPKRIAAFLAQVGHESKGLSLLQEEMNYSANELCEKWPRRFYLLPDTPVHVDQESGVILAKDRALATHYAHRPIAIGNHAYAGRFGNGDEASADGYNYRPRGPLPITGKATYTECGATIGVDIRHAPSRVLEPAVGALVAGWFWDKRKCNLFIDNDDFEGLTRALMVASSTKNYGIAERQGRFEIALNVVRDLGIR